MNYDSIKTHLEAAHSALIRSGEELDLHNLSYFTSYLKAKDWRGALSALEECGAATDCHPTVLARNARRRARIGIAALRFAHRATGEIARRMKCSVDETWTQTTQTCTDNAFVDAARNASHRRGVKAEQITLCSHHLEFIT
jgi:hypothetical protein